MAIEALDRRDDIAQRENALKRNINADQLCTLATLERFGWSLKFVRKSPLGPLAVCMSSSIHRRLIRGVRLPKKWNWIGTDGCIQKLRRPLPSPTSTSNMNASVRRSLFMTTIRRCASVRSSMSTEFAMLS